MGSGFRVWTAGEVVSASNVNNYLQEQAVMSFAGTAARSSAVASPEEGMLSYLQDTDTYQGYDGAAWVNLGTLSGASDSGLVHINTTSFSAVASQSINDVFSSTYDNYKIFLTITNNATLGACYIRLRAAGTDNSASNYAAAGQGVTDNNSARNTLQTLGSSGMKVGYAAASGIMHSDITMFNPFATEITSMYANTINTDTNTVGNTTAASRMTVTTSYDGFTIIPAGNITGIVRVYGVKN